MSRSHVVRKAVVPAAGTGTRLLPATKSMPKEMLPVGRKPVIQYVLEELSAADVREVLIVTSQQKRAIEDHFDLNGVWQERLETDAKWRTLLPQAEIEVQLFYTRQSVPRGLADAIARAEVFVGEEPFLVSLGDSILQSSRPGGLLQELIRLHLEKGARATILFEEVPPEAVVHYGIAKPKGRPERTFACEDLIEKPSPEEAPSNLAVAARYVFDPIVFEYIQKTPPGRNGEIQITDTMRLMLADGHPIWGLRMEVGERRLDIGNFGSYFEAFFELALQDPEHGQEFREYVRRRLQE
ncbi:MAG: UTP--glucose-1-phosphate uridylyltransferase [Candidatus Poribacteria bacterium]|nr:MAG: UTP--glucose-1-phosphate uridylyltransferase [Candidatus Poribacteria bacterium]